MNLRELVGKFIVFEKDPGLTPDAEIVSPAVTSTPLPSSASGVLQESNLDLSDIYHQAGLSPVPFTAEQALITLNSLPQELKPETKQQVLNEMLQAKSAALGTHLTVVIEDAKAKVNALTAAAEEISRQAADFIATTRTEIADLEEQIEEKHKAVEQVQGQEQELTKVCLAEVERLKTLLRAFVRDAKP